MESDDIVIVWKAQDDSEVVLILSPNTLHTFTAEVSNLSNIYLFHIHTLDLFIIKVNFCQQYVYFLIEEWSKFEEAY